jgi:hypothetical protein
MAVRAAREAAVAILGTVRRAIPDRGTRMDVHMLTLLRGQERGRAWSTSCHRDRVAGVSCA